MFVTEETEENVFKESIGINNSLIKGKSIFNKKI